VPPGVSAVDPPDLSAGPLKDKDVNKREEINGRQLRKGENDSSVRSN
jgi:hypothetical protein